MTQITCCTPWCSEIVTTAGEECERCQHERAKDQAAFRYRQEDAEARSLVAELLQHVAKHTPPHIERYPALVAKLRVALKALRSIEDNT